MLPLKLHDKTGTDKKILSCVNKIGNTKRRFVMYIFQLAVTVTFKVPV